MFEFFDDQNYDNMIEAILFVSGEPVKVSRLAAVLGIEEDMVENIAGNMRDRYISERRGIRLIKLDDSLQLCSSPEFSEDIRRALETRKQPKLSQPALEVLAVVAYFQPITRVFIEQVRGVDSAYTLGLLLERGLVEACGRLAAPGRPVIYRTSLAFLRMFGLESLSDLPELPDAENTGDAREGIQNAILKLKMSTQEQGAISSAPWPEGGSDETDSDSGSKGPAPGDPI